MFKLILLLALLKVQVSTVWQLCPRFWARISFCRWKFGFDENLVSMKMNVNGGNAPTSSVNTICLHCREQKQVLFEVNFIIWKLRGYIQGFGGHCWKQCKFQKVILGVISRVLRTMGIWIPDSWKTETSEQWARSLFRTLATLMLVLKYQTSE